MVRKLFLVTVLILCMVLCSCRTGGNGIQGPEDEKNISKEVTPSVPEQTTPYATEQWDASTDEIARIYLEGCGFLSDRKLAVETFVRLLGEAGCVAVDSENKLDMTCYEKMLSFVEAVNNGKDAAVKVIVVPYLEGYSIYSFSTHNGTVHVMQSYYSVQEDRMTETERYAYDADYFAYTEEGYLMIEGQWHLEEQYLLTLSDGEEHLALRVEPLPSENRLIGNRYIASVGYAINNMFITDWNRDDFGKLDFYDIFQVFYQENYGKQFPYVMSADLSVGAEYRISAKEFEEVVTTHIPVAAEALRERLRYDSQDNCYLFRPRGYREFDYPDIPYPEVISCEANEDGSVTLTVRAVYPSDNTADLFTHRVTLREQDGKVFYESNEIIDVESIDTRWHADRFTDEEWEAFYSAE